MALHGFGLDFVARSLEIFSTAGRFAGHATNKSLTCGNQTYSSHKPGSRPDIALATLASLWVWGS
eukprot:191790-Amphidinium_carterae.1